MALVNPNIAMSYRGIELPQQNALADYAAVQQIQGGRQTQELNQMKMQEYERARTEEEGLRNYLAQADFAKPEARTGLARFGKTGLAYGKALTEQDTAALTQREAAFKVQKAKGDFIAQAKRDTSQNPSDANLTAFKEDLLANPLFTEPEKLQLGANIDRILTMPVGERRSFMASQGASPGELKPTVQSVNRGGQTDVLSVPAFTGTPTTLTQLADVPLPPLVEAQKSRIGKASAASTSVNVSTEKKYGENLAGKIADRDDAKLGAAEKAPQLAESANRIIDLVKQGNVFTGPIADIKLNVARGLNVLGASNEEKIANTELLIAATGQSTLDAIKSAGLGTGQGFTDKDLNFLRGIAGGKIDFRPETLTELARLQHLAATRSVQAWNTRFKDIPKSSIEGMGLRTAPDVPPLSPSAIFARNPKTNERIQSLDGGNTWKPVGGK
jgi:hypothetical protein